MALVVEQEAERAVAEQALLPDADCAAGRERDRHASIARHQRVLRAEAARIDTQQAGQRRPPEADRITAVRERVVTRILDGRARLAARSAAGDARFVAAHHQRAAIEQRAE